MLKRSFLFLLMLMLLILFPASCGQAPAENPAKITTESSSSTEAVELPYLILAEETVAHNTKMTMETQITLPQKEMQAGIFWGISREWANFGYLGYAVLVEEETVTLYRVEENLKRLASSPLNPDNGSINLRVVLQKNTCSVYTDDQTEGEAFPLIQYPIQIASGHACGTVVLAGTPSMLPPLTVTLSEPDRTYQNPVLANYADPDVLLYDGTYYLYATGNSRGYRVYTSKDLAEWRFAGQAVTPDLWGIEVSYWAPDVAYIDGKFYMVVTCDEKLGLAVSDSPLGPFREAHDSVFFERTIDGHLYVDDDGTVYLYYVSWRENHAYGIYGVQLDENLYPVLDTETLLMVPEEEWEKQQSPIVEGPFILKRKGIYYLTYSGSHYESKNYAVGYATSTAPLGSYVRYEGNPILIGNDKVSGTGHHCITTSLDGEELWIVYHQHCSTTQIHERKICIDRIRFCEAENGYDILEVFGPTTIPQPLS